MKQKQKRQRMKTIRFKSFLQSARCIRVSKTIQTPNAHNQCGQKITFPMQMQIASNFRLNKSLTYHLYVKSSENVSTHLKRKRKWKEKNQINCVYSVDDNQIIDKFSVDLTCIICIHFPISNHIFTLGIN